MTKNQIETLPSQKGAPDGKASLDEKNQARPFMAFDVSPRTIVECPAVIHVSWSVKNAKEVLLEKELVAAEGSRPFELTGPRLFSLNVVGLHGESWIRTKRVDYEESRQKQWDDWLRTYIDLGLSREAAELTMKTCQSSCIPVARCRR